MATDNHHPGSTSLFPDPQERFDRTIPAPTPPPSAANGSRPEIPAWPNGEDDFLADADGFVDDTDEHDFDADTASTAASDDTLASTSTPQPMSILDGGPPPLWVRTHIPADLLVPTAPTRRFRRTRNTAPPADPAIDLTHLDPEPEPVTPAGIRTGSAAARRRRGSIAVAAAAAVVLLSAAAAATALTFGDDNGPSLATPETTEQNDTTDTSSTAATPDTATAAEAPWCTEQTTADAVTTSAAGDLSSAAGVIAAFEHAYYVQRSGTAVAALMVSPAPPDRIQAAIDQTPDGTEHCATITPADAPDVFAVALTLRTPAGSESAIASRITTARTDQSYAISSIEEIR